MDDRTRNNGCLPEREVGCRTFWDSRVGAFASSRSRRPAMNRPTPGFPVLARRFERDGASGLRPATTLSQMSRPRVAVLATVYFFGSHADVIGTRLIEGYEWGGEHVPSRVEVASMYLEQRGCSGGSEGWLPDIGVEIAERANVPLFPTIGEAIGCGRGGVEVDGVVIIGEHGDYDNNQLGQKLYPRRRMFDAAVAAMVAGGKTVPVFNDKHLSASFGDAITMVETARRLSIPMVAGSTIPLAWRVPVGSEWPFGEPMTEAVVVGFGGAESYGFHTLEGLQVHAERRAGGESGVRAVRALSGVEALAAVEDGTVNAGLLERALKVLDLDEPAREEAKRSATNIFLVEYIDGLRAAVLTCESAVRNWSAACRGPQHEMACQMFLPGTKPGTPNDHFTFLVRQIESLVIDGKSPYPVERTLLTTGILDAAMRSRHGGGVRLETPELGFTYRPAEQIPDTGVPHPYPEPVRPATRQA